MTVCDVLTGDLIVICRRGRSVALVGVVRGGISRMQVVWNANPARVALNLRRYDDVSKAPKNAEIRVSQIMDAARTRVHHSGGHHRTWVGPRGAH